MKMPFPNKQLLQSLSINVHVVQPLLNSLLTIYSTTLINLFLQFQEIYSWLSELSFF